MTRLRTILRLQRDEFLPLRVIRQELASGRGAEEAGEAPPSLDQRGAPDLARPLGRDGYTLDEIVEETGTDERLVRELEELWAGPRRRARRRAQL